MQTTQQGFSLIEVLVTVFIVSIGLLGLAALQANAFRYNHEGYLRSVAVSQAYAMSDRIRANPGGFEAGSYNNISGISSQPVCVSTCSTAQIAQLDTYEWNSNNANRLPNGQGTVSANGNIMTITVYYDQDKTGAAGLDCSGNKDIDLTCVRIVTQM